MFVNTLKSFEKQHTRSRSFINNEVQSNNVAELTRIELGLEKKLDQEQLELKQILSDETKVCDDLDKIVCKLKALQPANQPEIECRSEVEKVSTPRRKKPIIATIGLSKPSKPVKPKI